MGNITGSLSAISDVYTRNAIKSLGLEFQKLARTVSTIRRNNENVTAHSSLTDLDYASAGHTGFASSAALTAHTGNTSNPHSVTLQQAIAAGATASSEPTFNGGIDLGTSGRIDSNVANAASATSFLIQPSVANAGTDRWVFQIKDQSGDVLMSGYDGGLIEIGGNAAGSADGMLAVAAATSKNAGIFFAPLYFSGSGQTFFSTTNTVTGAYFRTSPGSSLTPTLAALVAGIFENNNGATLGANIGDIWGAWFRGNGGALANGNSTRTWARCGGIKVFPYVTAKNFGTFTDVFGIYVSQAVSNAATTGLVITNGYGVYIEEQTRAGTINNEVFISGAGGVWFRDQQLYIESTADGHLDLYADTSIDMNGDVDMSTVDLITDTSTGTKIGTGTTQKIGFWNVTPVVQYSTTGTATGYTGGGGTALTHTDTFTGNTGSTAYTIGDIVRALKLCGVILA